ncbi:MAG: glycosyltransferase family 2 protein [Rhodobacteraceae bacterium]|jgi:glycosyltransferase involved in cell wall biosynthesis|nr:glycosyltransferase family 2 protein [Paracoccaceae bacterium]
MTQGGTSHVTILMAVRNGASYLPEQLQSFAAQTHRNWHLIVSDDGSTDDSRAIIKAFGEQGHAVTILDGPQQGSAANFLSLVLRMPQMVPGPSWIAFSDQDDFWKPERLSAGLAALEQVAPDIPALFCSRLMITDAALVPRHISMLRPSPAGFRNALVQNIAAGSTALFNPAAARLLCEAAQEAGSVVMHDWWAYQLLTGVGGHVVHDDRALVYYRQHGQNFIGSNDTNAARARRFSMLMRGRFRAWMDMNVAALSRSAHRFTPENRAVLEAFVRMRESRLPLRLWRFGRLGIYRQRRIGTLVMWLSVLLGRL